MSLLPSFDPRTVPVHSVDLHLDRVQPERLTPEALRQRFRSPPLWRPDSSVERRFIDRPPAQAAVLVPLVMRAELSLLLTQRGQHLSTHSGQIAFPGGRCDDTDTDAVHTALREAVRAHAEPSPAATLMTSVRAGMAVCPEFRPAGKLLHATTEPLLSSAVE